MTAAELPKTANYIRSFCFDPLAFVRFIRFVHFMVWQESNPIFCINPSLSIVIFGHVNGTVRSLRFDIHSVWTFRSDIRSFCERPVRSIRYSFLLCERSVSSDPIFVSFWYSFHVNVPFVPIRYSFRSVIRFVMIYVPFREHYRYRYRYPFRSVPYISGVNKYTLSKNWEPWSGYH